MSVAGDLDELSHGMRASWQRFLDVIEPLRPELYRYCRYLTHSAWDAEDLAQDTLARAFVTLGTVFRELPNPRAWLFRVVSNLWIDRTRRRRREPALDETAEESGAPIGSDGQALREAAGTLLVRLSPQSAPQSCSKRCSAFRSRTSPTRFRPRSGR